MRKRFECEIRLKVIRINEKIGQLPIAKGHASFVRKVDSCGCVEFNAAEYFVFRRLERQCVVATL